MADTREQLLNNKLNYLNQTKQLFKTALQSHGVEISDEDTFRDYAYKVENLGGGDVLLFSTKQDMIDYKNPKEGSIAIIYNDINKNTIKNDYFKDISYVIFPSEVELDNTCSEYKSNYIFNASETNYTFDNRIGYVYIGPTEFSIEITNQGKIVEYSSTDGKHYKRITTISNPYKFDNPIFINIYDIQAQWNYFNKFILHDYGNFEGIFKCNKGVFNSIYTQSNLVTSNQLLSNVQAYGKVENINGDGSYISNIPMRELIAKYLSPMNVENSYFNLIQIGDKVAPLEFVERTQISIDSAFTTKFPQQDCVDQHDIYNLTHGPTYEYDDSLIIRDYINSMEKYNYSFFIGDKAYRLYFGYNYNSDEYIIEGVSRQMPKEITGIYGVIVDLEDLSVYNTFTNTDTWTFTSKGYGSILNYGYNSSSNEFIIITDLSGYGDTEGAYVGITKINVDTSIRLTDYYKIEVDTDFEFKKVINASYNKNRDCYYLAINSYENENNSTKHIIKIENGNITTVLSTEYTLQNINYFWTIELNDLNDLVFYKDNNNKYIIHNLFNNNKVYLYGDDIKSRTFCTIGDNYIYISNKLNELDEVYSIFKVSKDLNEINLISNTTSQNRLYNFLYRYNKNICIFMDNKILSASGKFLDYFKPVDNMVYSDTIRGVFGITKLNDYEYVTTWSANQLDNIGNYTTDGLFSKYVYYVYTKNIKFPISNDLCIVGSKNSSETNSSKNTYFLADSIVVSNAGSTITRLSNEINRLNSILNNINTLADIIIG